jgi:hypothetical protein
VKPTSEVVCCFVDNGIFLPVARRLAREFSKVFYWSPCDRAFPHLRERVIGDGFSDIQRIESIWEVKSQCDLFCFPDVGYGSLQKELIAQGYPVWGARDADLLEVSRGRFLDVLKTTGLPVPVYRVVKGLTNLGLMLREEEDKFVKVSKIRGDFETFHWRSWREDEFELDELAVKFGPLKEHITFYVFDPIDTEVEDGVDAYCIDGEWPKTVIHGMECKDKSYLGTFQKFSDLPEEVRIVNEAFSPVLKELGYRSRFSTEVRITPEGESYFIDPTCRFGSPPSQCEIEMVGNWGEIIWHGAHGDLVEMTQEAQFGIQAIIKIDRSSWQVIDIPEEVEQWSKFAFCCCVDDRICIPPDPDGIPEVGWMTAIGNTIEEAIQNLRGHVDQLPDGVCCEFSSVADLLKEVDTAEGMGMRFTDQKIPKPSSVVETK